MTKLSNNIFLSDGKIADAGSKYKLLELFAGSCSIGRAAKEIGYEVCSVDVKDFEGIDIVKDIEFLQVSDLPFIPTVIWGSPPCTTYSIAAIGRHRDMGTPKTDFAAKSDRLVLNTLKLINDLIKINPNIKWYLENPRGYLRKMPFMKGLPRTTVWYCQYGDNCAKPTDIWSNNIYTPLFNYDGWKKRPECFNGNLKCHHDKQPRGYKAKKEAEALGKGTQGKANNYERSKIPKDLCLEILHASKKAREEKNIITANMHEPLIKTGT